MIAAFWRDYDDPAMDPTLRDWLRSVGPGYAAAGWLAAISALQRRYS